MPLGTGIHQLAVNTARHFEKPVNRPTRKLDLQGVEMPAIADARDTAGNHGLASDSRNDSLLRRSDRGVIYKHGESEQREIPKEGHKRSAIGKLTKRVSQEKQQFPSSYAPPPRMR